MDPINPKVVQAAADGKAPLDYLEPAADEEISWAVFHGAQKYGRRNYKGVEMRMTTYIGAMERHIAALKRGEMIDRDSGRLHIGHIGACVHVWCGSLEAGTLINDTSVIEMTPRSDAVHVDDNQQAKAER